MIKFPPWRIRLSGTPGSLRSIRLRGDIDGYLKPCTEDFTFIVPGRGGISGAYKGKQGMLELVGKAMAITDGTFSEEVEDVLASNEHAVVLALHRFTRHGASKDYRTAHVYDVREGRTR